MEQQKKVLVIEDDEDVRYLIGASIQESIPNGILVDEFADAEAALNKCNQQKYDLIITDFKLPGMDGFDLIKRLNEHALNADCPILFISGYFTELEAAKHGKYFDNLTFIDKPFETSHLIMHVKIMLYGKKLTQKT